MLTDILAREELHAPSGHKVSFNNIALMLHHGFNSNLKTNIGVLDMSWNIMSRYALSKTMLDLIENCSYWRLTNSKQELSKICILLAHLLKPETDNIQSQNYIVSKTIALINLVGFSSLVLRALN